MHLLITGGTGFIGSYLTRFLLDQGHDVTILSRKKVKNKGNVRIISHISEINDRDIFDVIINLAGSNISKRWTPSYKQELINSRILITKNIISLIARLIKKPRLLISASAIGYYGAMTRDDSALDEFSDYSDNFTHQLCSQWETEARQAEQYGVRTCIARLGVVLGKDGGALKKMLPPFKFFLGGRIGSGKQLFSWIHIKDVISVFDVFIKDNEYNGVYNVTSEHPITNLEFTTALSRALKRPAVFPLPAFLIKLVYGEMGETLLLNSQNVIPKRLQQKGFKFQYSSIDLTLKDLCH